MQTFATLLAIESLLLDKLTLITVLETKPFPGLKSQRRFVSIRLQTQNGHPRRVAAAVLPGKAPYRSLFQLIRSPRVVVELETGALWASFL